jgi:hypothetical protein
VLQFEFQVQNCCIVDNIHYGLHSAKIFWNSIMLTCPSCEKLHCHNFSDFPSTSMVASLQRYHLLFKDLHLCTPPFQRPPSLYYFLYLIIPWLWKTKWFHILLKIPRLADIYLKQMVMEVINRHSITTSKKVRCGSSSCMNLILIKIKLMLPIWIFLL